mmetsp:Transcript_52437/g.135872  ORF Transcript_52437/g.135872 Transcript_52437/m.135872 type:complete len:102 (+) Transcript_52437:804-1109(+)
MLGMHTCSQPRMPDTLRHVPRYTVERMRRRLRCARRFLWYASMYGACAEGLEHGPDAFDGLMSILAARLQAGSGCTRRASECARESAVRALWKASCADDAT